MSPQLAARPTAGPTDTLSSHVAVRRVARPALRLALGVAAALALTAARGVAQGPATAGNLELRPYAGAYIPTGDQRDVLGAAVLAGAQAAWRVRPQLALTGTFGWSPSTSRIAAGRGKLDVYQYDVGAEGRSPAWLQGARWDLTPFAGIGIGARTYDYRDLDVDAKTNVAGYGALGGELGLGRLGFRVEARDYLSRYEPLTGGGDVKAHNDVTLAAGVTVRF